jgi:hypothetical protein
LIVREPKYPRTWVARLRSQRDSPDLHEAEAEAQQGVRHFRMFIEPRCYADRIVEMKAKRPHREPRVVSHKLDVRRNTQRPNCKPVRILGVEKPEKRACERIKQADHGARIKSGGNSDVSRRFIW